MMSDESLNAVLRVCFRVLDEPARAFLGYIRVCWEIVGCIFANLPKVVVPDLELKLASMVKSCFDFPLPRLE